MLNPLHNVRLYAGPGMETSEANCGSDPASRLALAEERQPCTLRPLLGGWQGTLRAIEPSRWSVLGISALV